MDVVDQDYPCIYLNSNAISIYSQRIYKIIVWISLVIMLVSTILNSKFKPSVVIKFDLDKINGFLLLLGALISAILTVIEPSKNWYLGRAVAESIKTISWKYMMRAAPFDIDNQKDVKKLFIDRCDDIRNAVLRNKNFAPAPGKFHNDYITPKMNDIRNLAFLERKKVYEKERIISQINWYNIKSRKNNNTGKIYMTLLVLCQFSAAVYLFFLNSNRYGLDITSILIFISVSCISIIELNKFRDLSQSYSLTAFELNSIKNKFGSIIDECDLDIFVDDAEQAISREHTMWLARRGHSK